ncbi:HK97 family phage prohead protease [Rhodococcus kroppenstedtii]|uniref:HK97 family phage prohead protease n=1 Tax=Rhodococcoides kroppenstedtii TaxID=293050 RepID=UPI002955C0DD|nr:HK97 family phage prohead protease [Rhodococcus kroppenstedtii]MDV7196907.1 HK97 family phage prohead protease [Rhodococcus kroppenstedtii]
MHTQVLTRTLPSNFETRSGEATATGLRIEGYGATFNSPTHIRGWEGDFEESIAPGAFRKTLRANRNNPPIMQWNHGRDSRVGQVPIGAYDVIEEDSHGLRVEGDLFDNPVVEPIRQAIAGGAVRGMSFKFTVVKDAWRDNSGKLLKPAEVSDLLWSPGQRGPLQRTLLEVELHELGPVSTPAYKSTSIKLRDTLDPTMDLRKLILNGLI